MPDPQGQLVIISGPSGSGKSTVVRRLLEACPLPLTPSVSATTRAPRPGEADGRDYHFLARDEFNRRRFRGDFLECMEVYGQNWYGTLRATVEEGLKAGRWMVLEIDIHGAIRVLDQVPEAITVAVLPASLDELRRRLRDRNTDSDDDIERRLSVAENEIRLLKERYAIQVINDRLDRVVDEICESLQSYRPRS